MDLIIGIEIDKEDEENLRKQLSALKQKTIVINFMDKAEDYVRSARPNAIIMAYNPSEKFYADYIRKFKHDPVIREVPVIAIIDKVDSNFNITHKRIGFTDFILRPINKYDLETKIQEALYNSKMTKGKQKHIEVLRSFSRTSIQFNSSLVKHVLPEFKNILTAPVLKAISGDKICIDLRNVPNMISEEVLILERLITLFGQKRIGIIAGKYMGLLISSGNIQESCDLFMSMEEFDEFVKKKS